VRDPTRFARESIGGIVRAALAFAMAYPVG
jgi:hypothetical protein